MLKLRIPFFLIGFITGTTLCSAQTVTDVEGNTYPVITIGQQEWMGENLRTTHFANGEVIPTAIEQVNNDPSSIYQWCYDNDTNNVSVYGRLYSWYAVKDNRAVCPSGWKVPSMADWDILSQTLGGDSLAGFSLKETGTIHWDTTAQDVTNSSGFTALPGGFKGNSTLFLNEGMVGYFWSTDQFGFDQIFQRGQIKSLQSTNGIFSSSVGLGSCGLSVRCIRDEALGEPEFGHQQGVLFPNPAEQSVTIRFNESASGILRIVSTEGKILEEHPYNQELLLDVSHFAAGTYFLRLETGNVVLEKQLIIR